ncbi:MAG: GNAT family N-acetyltransferase [Bdellovibrionales bacterium]|nr:GNAT family N-acetyltransferase [Bdellovibrionales bacterium]
MADESVIFKEMAKDDLPHVLRWRREPHVEAAWNRGETDMEILKKYEEKITSSVVRPYIFHLNGKRGGYIQYYWAARCGEGWWEGYDSKTVGIDLFIGEPEFLRKGWAKQVISQFCAKLFSELKIERIIADPAPANQGIRRCLESCGFTDQGVIETPDGPARLMILEK